MFLTSFFFLTQHFHHSLTHKNPLVIWCCVLTIKSPSQGTLKLRVSTGDQLDAAVVTFFFSFLRCTQTHWKTTRKKSENQRLFHFIEPAFYVKQSDWKWVFLAAGPELSSSLSSSCWISTLHSDLMCFTLTEKNFSIKHVFLIRHDSLICADESSALGFNWRRRKTLSSWPEVHVKLMWGYTSGQELSRSIW